MLEKSFIKKDDLVYCKDKAQNIVIFPHFETDSRTCNNKEDCENGMDEKGWNGFGSHTPNYSAWLLILVCFLKKIWWTSRPMYDFYG